MDGRHTDMEKHVRALGSAISRREWSDVEAAHAAIRECARTGPVPDDAFLALERAIERMGWPEINAFHQELARGQDVREDGGGYWHRAIRRLFGLPSTLDTVETYKDAARAMVRRAA